MNSFQITLINVLTALIFMIPGFIISKIKKESINGLNLLSTILIYVLSPALMMSSFLNMEFNVNDLISMGWFLLMSTVVQVLFMGLMYLIFKRKMDNPEYRVLTISSVLGNVGFFGLPLVKSLFPDNYIVCCYSSIFVVSMNILVFTVGTFALTSDKKYMNPLKIILNPSSLAFIFILPLYIIGAKSFVPSWINELITLLGRMTTPVCMLMLGIRLGAVPLRNVFLKPFAYLTIALKLVIYPLFAYLLVYFLPFDIVFKQALFILCASPSASVILGLAELYKKGEDLASTVVLLSTLTSLITIPLLALLL